MIDKGKSSCSLSQFVLIFGILSVFCVTLSTADKLVGLNGGDSQNSRYVEIRRSPGNRKAAAAVDVLSLDAMPKAHGLVQHDDEQQQQIRRSPQQQPQQQQNGLGFSSPFASMMPSLTNPFPMMLPMHHHHQLHQHPSLMPLSPHQPQPASNGGNTAATLSPIPLQTPIPTLSATLHPAFTLLPTLPTLSFPTFPPFTMPPAFDQMASGYTKKKRRHKSRRKSPKKQLSSESDNEEYTKKRASKKLEKVESRLPKYATEETNPNLENKKEDWMVPYYGNNKRKQKS